MKRVRVVQLNGALPKHPLNTGAANVVESLAAACGGDSYLFPAPAIVDTPALAAAMRKDSSISGALALAAGSDTCIFSIGAVRADSVLYKAGYFNEAEYENLARAKAVGDVCSHFFTEAGELADKALDKRVMGISLAQLRRVETRIAIAVGEHKAAAVLGALNGEFLNVLYTDEKTAAKVLQMRRKMG